MDTSLDSRLQKEATCQPGQAHSVTFEVDEVTPASEPLSECKMPAALHRLAGVRPEACSDPHESVIGVGQNALVRAAHCAYADHRPLVLSPDMIWLTIVQGLAEHVEDNAEELRHLFVSHAGRQRLVIREDRFRKGDPANPWPVMFSTFSDMVRSHIGDEMHSWLVADFSTTGPVERAASEIALLDVVKPFFEYEMMTICGIPRVTLEGTVEDWRRLVSKARRLEQFSLDFWTCHLVPICEQFARAAAGDVDLAHWQSLYKVRREYSRNLISGWICKLFPYIHEAAPALARNAKGQTIISYRRLSTASPVSKRRNPMLALEPQDHGFPGPGDRELDLKRTLAVMAAEGLVAETGAEGLESNGGARARPSLTMDVLPLGFSRVPFGWTVMTDNGKADIPMEFMAGLLAIRQDRNSLALRPKIGWAVCEQGSRYPAGSNLLRQ
ncbi:MAG: DUF4419 domain-containing protein [Phycisphaerae bacterium]|nr:DUF4419 domain-containing protein [Phycisphaerae bacterium]